jgi:hypothetical protein
MAKRKVEPKLFRLLLEMLRQYARQLREQNPGVVIRNAAVFESALRQLSKRKYIQVIGGSHDRPDWRTDVFDPLLQRVKNHPIWVPGPNFPGDTWDLFKIMQPSYRNGRIVWRHKPSRKRTARELWLDLNT